MLSVIVMNVDKLSAIMLNVVILSVVAPGSSPTNTSQIMLWCVYASNTLAYFLYT